jgi:rare lipoprotein A
MKSIKALALGSILTVVSGVLPVQALPLRASATYYADYFVGRKMANGVRFYQSSMVAAHPYLKLGTRVKVSYKGRSVLVTITDRCNCSIDLSKAAFRQLAPLRVGRIPVQVTRSR